MEREGMRFYSGAWRTEEAIEIRRAQDRERSKNKEYIEKKRIGRQLRREKDPIAYKEKANAKDRAKYHRNKEKYNARRARYRQENAEKDREYQRNLYAKNREAFLQKIKERRKARKPIIGLHKAIIRFRDKTIDKEELGSIFRETIARVIARRRPQENTQTSPIAET